jgi:hypothetical protein
MMQQSNILSGINANILATLGLRQQVIVSGKSPKARLLGLSQQLNNWNIARISGKNQAATQDLSIEDVHLLKEIIHAEIKRTSVKQAEVVSDQILFLVIGAIQIQSQNHSAQAWKLVDQSIQKFLKPQRPVFLYTLASSALIIAIVATTALRGQKLHQAVSNNSILETGEVSDPVSMGLLLNIYNKMKDGTCQLPQAAMLPIEQRQAFLSFINEGNVDVRNVANLKLALTYVNCLYPQDLMHSAQ